MKCIIYLLALLLVPITINSQNIQGVIYDAESKLKDIKVYNLSKQTTTYSNDGGNFSINASVNDTLIFSSLFYEQKREIITQDHFENSIVIELKKIMNNLGEVVVNDRSKTNQLNLEIHSNGMGEQLSDDIKKNPHLYDTSSSYGFDLVRIFKLFKKNKIEPDAIEPIYRNQFEELFAKDNFLNDKFLVKQLEIPLEYKPLFFDYLEAQNINGTFINDDKKMLLLEELFKHSKAFKIFLSDYNQGKIKD